MLISPLCYSSLSFTLNNLNLQQISNNNNSGLNDNFEWICVDRLALNLKKTKNMIFHYRQGDVRNLIPSFKINNEPVERVTEINFLSLSPKPLVGTHMYTRYLKMSRILGIMGRSKSYYLQISWD